LKIVSFWFDFSPRSCDTGNTSKFNEREIMNSPKLVGNAKLQAQAAAAYQEKMEQRWGKNSVEFHQIAARKLWK